MGGYGLSCVVGVFIGILVVVLNHSMDLDGLDIVGPNV